jgi:hypothetical protein
MSVTDTTADKAAPKPAPSKSNCGWRGAIFVYDLVIIFALLGVAWIYVHGVFNLTQNDNINIAIRSMWFGALGGIVISLKGVYDHCCDRGDWDECFNLWHVGRPFSGGLTGLITLVLLLAINQNAPNEPIVYSIAFIFGTQERRFFNFLSEVAALVVRVPNEDGDKTLKVASIQPTEGKENALMIVRGAGFQTGVVVTVGDNKLGNVTVSKDGTTIAGVVPAGTAGNAVDVTIVNPDGGRTVASDKFTYLA